MRHTSLVDPIYYAPVDIVVGSPEEARAWFDQHPEFHVTEDLSEAQARGTTLESHEAKRWMVWIRRWEGPATPVNYGTLAHESFHLTSMILRDRGVRPAPESDEAFAYYLTAIFVQLVQAVTETAPSKTRKGKRR